MPNEEYQRLLRAAPPTLRERLPADRVAAGARSQRSLAELDDDELLARSATSAATTWSDLLDAFARGRCRDRPAVGDLRLHDQGLAAGHPGPSRQPLGAADRASSGSAAGSSSAPTRRPVGAVRATARRRPSCAATAAERLRREPVEPGAVRAGSAATWVATTRGQRVHPAGLRAVLCRPRAHRARGGRPRRDGQPRCRLLHQPRRLDQPCRDLASRRPHRLVRRRHRHAGALARVRARPAHRARDRRGQPGRAARRAGRDVVARRPAPAADRHPV